MSRDSGAGAYSHGIAAPSPSPQLEGAWSTRVSRPSAGASRSGVFVAIAVMIARVTERGEWSGRSAVVRRQRVTDLAEPDVDVVVVAAERGRQAVPDEDRVVEEDDLDVARGVGPEAEDHL